MVFKGISKKNFTHILYKTFRSCEKRFMSYSFMEYGFHRYWYYSDVWTKIKWFGVEIQQNPMDLIVLQEIIYETKPQFLIETGTYRGGTALFFAHMFDILGSGHVITIDIEDKCLVQHPRITRIIGDSVSHEVVNKVDHIVKGKPSMVFLDSAHNKDHVYDELETYCKFVGKNNYMVVADTNINGHPVLPFYVESYKGEIKFGGPMEAIKLFLSKHPEFIVDKSREYLKFTFFPSGFLKRIR